MPDQLFPPDAGIPISDSRGDNECDQVTTGGSRLGAPNGPTLRRRRLARRLRQLREEARLTLAEAAPKLDKTKSALSRVEKGETGADVHLIRTMMDVYDKQVPELNWRTTSLLGCIASAG
jgi:DNA-binding XRE family transcriptional regulator